MIFAAKVARIRGFEGVVRRHICVCGATVTISSVRSQCAGDDLVEGVVWVAAWVSSPLLMCQVAEATGDGVEDECYAVRMVTCVECVLDDFVVGVGDLCAWDYDLVEEENLRNDFLSAGEETRSAFCRPCCSIET